MGQWALALSVCALLAMPLGGIFQYSDRISTLSSLQVDAVAYDTIGVNLAKERSLDAIPPLQPPGFVTFLALIYTLFGHSWIAAKVALWVALVGITALAWRLARRMYGSELAGWIAALLCASSPALGWYVQTVQYEVLAALLVIGLVMMAVPGRNDGPQITFRRAVVIGLVAAAAVLTREVLGVLIPIVALAVGRLAGVRQGVAAAWRVGAIVAIVPLVTVAAWSGVQSIRSGRPVTLSDKGPLVLAFGNNPHADGTFNVGRVGVGEPSGLAFIRAVPRQAAWLAVRKVLYFWGVLRDGWNVPRPAAVWVSRATRGWVPLERVLPWARGGWLLAVLSIALLLWARPTWRAWWPIPAAIAMVMAVHVVTVSSHRFAVPILPLAFVVAAGPLTQLVQALWRRPLLRMGSAAALVACSAAQLLPSPLIYHVSAADMEGTMVGDLFDEGAGAIVRVADPTGGVRPVLLLLDEALPSGVFDIRITARTDQQLTNDSRAALRMTVMTLDGAAACTYEVTASTFEPTYRTLSLPCSLEHSGPVSLLVDTLAVVPLCFSDVTLSWR